jgi:hypothetical protein
MTTQTMIFRELDGFITVSHGALPPANSDWDAWCDLVRELRLSLQGAIVMVPPSCPGPNATQRKSLTEVWPKGAQARNSIITTSQLHRALITAMTFFIGNRFTAYAPSDWQKGFGNVAPRPLWGRLLRTFEQDLRELGSLDECLSAGLDPGAWAASLDGT